LTTAVAAVAGCCCGEPVLPCKGCNLAGYASPVSAISVAMQIKVNGMTAAVNFGFAPLYNPFVFQTDTVCRWTDPAQKTSAPIPSINGAGYYILIMKGCVCQPQISFGSLLGYLLFPLVDTVAAHLHAERRTVGESNFHAYRSRTSTRRTPARPSSSIAA